MAYEYQVEVNGVMHGMKQLKYIHTGQMLYESLSPGNAVAAKLDMTYWSLEALPDAGDVKIVPYEREQGTEEWHQLGVFWLDTVDMEGTATKIEAYDTMLRADRLWVPGDELNFPMADEAASEEIAREMGVELDPRCAFWNTAERIDYPADRTLREALCDIAGANLGNWIITAEGKLLLIPLFDSMPPETHYLIDEDGMAITFGGVRILI